ncbi:MAG: hypothetical protein LBF43_01545, partial [Puniceicoccales bacterium]|nr:hypothetical protein [Puniceicoccales bacterium]
TPKDVTADGLQGLVDRLRALAPAAGTQEGNLLKCLEQIQKAINDPTQVVSHLAAAGTPATVHDALSNICSGLASLNAAIVTTGDSGQCYAHIKATNADAGTPIGQFCPANAVEVALTGLKQEVVAAVVKDIGDTDAADLADMGRINGFGDRLGQVDLAKGSDESNQVGLALLAKLTGAGPWQAMAASGDAGIADLQAQVAAFETHFGVPVPDDIKNARVVVAAPPPPPDAGDQTRGQALANNNFRELKALHLDGKTGTDSVIPKATAKTQLEAMLQAYRNVCAYAATLRPGPATTCRQSAGEALSNNLQRALRNVTDLPADQLNDLTREMFSLKERSTSEAQCIAILQKYIDACTT